MNLTTSLRLAVAAALAFSSAAFAADRPAPGGEPTPAQIKARKMKKPVYTKTAEALKAAEACGQPILAFLLIEQNDVKPEARTSDFLEKKLMTNKFFKDDIAKQNVILLKLKVKKNAKDLKKIDMKSLKEPDQKFYVNFGVDEQIAAQWKRQDKELTHMDAVNYPAVVCITPDGTRALFRLGKYDKEGGIGVWLSQVVDTLRSRGVEPVMSEKLTKMLEDPTTFGKKK